MPSRRWHWTLAAALATGLAAIAVVTLISSSTSKSPTRPTPSAVEQTQTGPHLILGTFPVSRERTVMTYDVARRDVVLFGGADSNAHPLDEAFPHDPP
jgi:hypothetical protein